MSPALIRSFVAVGLKDEGTIRSLVRAQRLLSSTRADLKLIKPENVHLTLWFLGEIPVSRVEEVAEAMKKLRFRPFDLEFKGVGYFPGGRRVRVVWGGINDPSNTLREIYSQLSDILISLGFRRDRRGFSPHFTLCRVKSAAHSEELLERIREMRDMRFGAQHVTEIELKKSVLTPKGPLYTTLLSVSGEG